MKDLVTFIKETKLSRNGESPTEGAWEKMITKGDTKSILNFIEVARTDKELKKDTGVCVLSTVKDDTHNPIVEIYAWENYKVFVFRFSEDGVSSCVYNKRRAFITDLIDVDPNKAFYINDKIGNKWCSQIKKLDNE